MYTCHIQTNHSVPCTFLHKRLLATGYSYVMSSTNLGYIMLHILQHQPWLLFKRTLQLFSVPAMKTRMYQWRTFKPGYR